MKYFSIFNGIGGFELGIERATQRYKQLGNAVTVNVIEAIVRAMIKKGY